jgi:hypothetical protein
MAGIGERQNGAIHSCFDRSIPIDFRGAMITSDTGFLLMRQGDERLKLPERAAFGVEDPRPPAHTDHSLLQMRRQKICQVAAGYEDCNVADHLRVVCHAGRWYVHISSVFPLARTCGIILACPPDRRGGKRVIDSGTQMCPEMAKDGLMDISLACSIEESYGFAGFGVAWEVIRAKIQSRNAVRMHSARLDALFRFMYLDACYLRKPITGGMGKIEPWE